MRLAIMALAALALTGCAGWKLGGGYDFDSKQFFFNLEKPLNGFDK
jgi:hypothetical protein